MDLAFIQDYCENKKGVTAHFPFDEDVLVFKVINKMFLLTGLSTWEKNEPYINVKCDPEKAIELREEYPETIKGAYHMSKKHWNSIYIDGTLDQKQIMHWIDHSYDLIVKSLPKKDRLKLETL
jgi:predicted DNA-binding protein (MmcQ/YjbR family)